MATMTLSAKIAAFVQEYATLLSLYSEMLDAEAYGKAPKFGWAAMSAAARATFANMEEHYRAVPATTVNNGILAEGMAVSAIISDVCERKMVSSQVSLDREAAAHCPTCGRLHLPNC